MRALVLLFLVILIIGTISGRRIRRTSEEEDDVVSQKKPVKFNMADNEIDEIVTTPGQATAEDTQTPETTAQTSSTTSTTTQATTARETTEASQKNNRKPGSQNTKESRRDETRKKSGIDAIDEFLLDGLLTIIDEKFNTLSKRLLTLERGVNNLQYFNVRSFRVVNTHLHALDTILHGMHSEINQVDIQNRGLEQSVGSVKRDIVDLQSMNSEMFEAIEQNLVHFHKDVKNRMSEFNQDVSANKNMMQSLQNDSAAMATSVRDLKRLSYGIVENTEALLMTTTDLAKSQAEVKNTTAVVLKTTGHLVVNTEGIGHSAATISRSLASLNTKTDEIQAYMSDAMTNMSSGAAASAAGSSGTGSTSDDGVFHSGDASEDDLAKYQEMKVSSSKVDITVAKLVEYLDDKFRHLMENRTANASCIWPDSDDFRNQSQTLIRALATVNENVFHSLSFYRHTGDLIERLLADTELVAMEQVRLREDLADFIANSSLYMDMSNYTSSIEATLEGSEQCVLSKNIVNQISRMTTNNTQLIELMTDLAGISSTAIKTSLTELNREITRLNTVHEDSRRNSVFHRAESLTREKEETKVKGPSPFAKELHNKTDLIYQFVEAIASNTGWIPYIFHNMRFVENQVNKTLKLSSDIYKNSADILKHQRASAPTPPPPIGTDNGPKLAKTLLKQQLLNAQNAIDKPVVKSTQEFSSTPVKHREQDFRSFNETMGQMMEFVYDTNVKMDRLIPALTNLLGEPEPYISLMNGKSDREGRVEIYSKGRWGTICDRLGHIEASYICRSLGYLGGISAGSGSFGPGSNDETFWTVNVTCLRTHWCDAVSPVIDADACSHDNDFAVICDHMLRMTPSEENEGARNQGMLEMYHDNRWSPVCSRGWGRNETQVVCRQLGFREGAHEEVKDDTLTDTHWLTHVTCKGNEDRLDACVLDGFEFNGCPDFKFIAVLCS